MRSLLIVLVLVLVGCGKGPTQPNPPVPTPGPQPTPSGPPAPTPVTQPLRVSGNRFVVGGQVVLLTGMIPCCGPEGYGPAEAWPLIDMEGLETIAAHHGNFTHVRVGPFFDEPDILSRLQPLLGPAQRLGIYVEVDLIDGWAAKTGNLVWPDDRCGIFKQSPQARHDQWVREVVRATATFPNVLYQVGNENGVCGTTASWEWGIRKIAIDEMERMGVFRLVGTNAQDIDIEMGMDYASYHNRTPSELGGFGWPVAMNEVNPPDKPEDFCRYLDEAAAQGVNYHLWLGWPPLSNEDRQRSLNCMKTKR